MNRFIAKMALPALTGLALLSSCGRDPQDPGMEYAPQMYHSIPYEPYSQITDSTNENYNTMPVTHDGSNLRKPVAGTIKRKTYKHSNLNTLAGDIMEYGVPHPDSIVWSEKNLHNPLPASPQVLEEGKVLFTQYCAPCHGAGGAGDGKVAALYGGVANLVSGRSKGLNEGHIFHTITYGYNRMWPHGTQINPEDRWRIVRYVKDELQKQ